MNGSLSLFEDAAQRITLPFFSFFVFLCFSGFVAKSFRAQRESLSFLLSCFSVSLYKHQMMRNVINIEFPESLAHSLKLKGKEFEDEVKTASLVKLFELGKVSSGTAAKVLQISRLEFLDLLAKYRVSAFGPDDLEELKNDIANA